MKLRAHPPERRRRGVTLAAHGCCCCCCCCLHSLGGLIGAAVGGAGAAGEDARRTVKIYWLSFLPLAALTAASFAKMERNNVAFGLVMAALTLPGAQLMASFVTLCASVFAPIDLRTLGKITWKGFLWGLIGFLVMAVPFMAIAYLG